MSYVIVKIIGTLLDILGEISDYTLDIPNYYFSEDLYGDNIPSEGGNEPSGEDPNNQGNDNNDDDDDDKNKDNKGKDIDMEGSDSSNYDSDSDKENYNNEDNEDSPTDPYREESSKEELFRKEAEIIRDLRELQEAIDNIDKGVPYEKNISLRKWVEDSPYKDDFSEGLAEGKTYKEIIEPIENYLKFEKDYTEKRLMPPPSFKDIHNPNK